MATNFLKAILPVLKQERKRIRLPKAMVSSVLSEAYWWAGEELLNAGDRWAARSHLFRSLRYNPFRPRVIGLLAAASLPGNMGDSTRQIYRAFKALSGIDAQRESTN